ncbi:MAG: hypothetical protein KJN78_09275 [Gammaproteobacteria bacterium]|nr:hypothetical protein [Gammaproteobacteria bacterium]
MNKIFLGESQVKPLPEGGRGRLVRRGGETYYCIENYHAMRPFFMTVVSGYDHWMFVSSTGGLTCGRRDPDHALFPYTTDDKIHDASTTTGPLTCLQVNDGERLRLWKPFEPGTSVYRLERNLYKNLEGNRLVFEETNHDLGLTFSYSWTTGETLGFIRKAELRNDKSAAVDVRLIDGLQNLLPSGVGRSLQNDRSTLVDAYKQAEAVPEAKAGLYTLSSILTDRAEPSEALRATVAWVSGIEQTALLVSDEQLRHFCSGAAIDGETFKKGQRGAFLLQAELNLEPGHTSSWYTVADIGLGPAQVSDLLGRLRRGVDEELIEKDIRAGTRRLRQLVGSADGFQAASDALTTRRHFSNTLFNVMRGGVFDLEYELPVSDFLGFVSQWNRPLIKAFAERLPKGGGAISLADAIDLAREAGHPDMQRLGLEYLPLTFSRRHGDPSRPWNHFSIEVRRSDGTNSLGYQGNWRDIFQNWEALSLSYPEFIESFIAKFVNASTPDGYNAYRISENGFDWEVLDPDDPWSNIGYWGDHQVAYLERLLELSRRYHPGRLEADLERDIFVYADVPYRLKSYREQLRDPRNTIEYDSDREKALKRRVEALGIDGQLVAGPDGDILHVNLLEKLLVPALSKISNLVPGGGIWMNTQRPEWNDANNALVGSGLSMVTLCYLRRYVALLNGLLEDCSAEDFPVSVELLAFFEALDNHLAGHDELLDGAVSDRQRKDFMDDVGAIGDAWRDSLYSGLGGERSGLERKALSEFLARVTQYLDHSIGLNRRDDGLFHSYNLVRFDDQGFAVEHLEPMLEGQVAVLSCGFLDLAESLELLEALRSSPLYREDEQSYMLYPDRALPSFRKKNVIPSDRVEGFDWLDAQLRRGRNPYVEQDREGVLHFNGELRNVEVLRQALSRDRDVSDNDAKRLCTLYESVFNHRRFKGRSGSMYKYEGLGCIYWHMVSKLALSVAEIARLGAHKGASVEQVKSLSGHYRAIRNGLGVHKSPMAYGAFTTDPYSHTPGFSGVQQPGLTGQVKEDVIARFCELGVAVDGGRLSFAPVLLERKEFLDQPRRWRFSNGTEERVENLSGESLAFTLCGIPVVYRLADRAAVTVTDASGASHSVNGTQLGRKMSDRVFGRDKQLTQIVVDIERASLRA